MHKPRGGDVFFDGLRQISSSAEFVVNLEDGSGLRFAWAREPNRRPRYALGGGVMEKFGMYVRYVHRGSAGHPRLVSTRPGCSLGPHAPSGPSRVVWVLTHSRLPEHFPQTLASLLFLFPGCRC